MEVNNCNGKCFLSKQLKKAADKEKKETESLREKQELVYTYSVTENNTLPYLNVEKSKVLVTHTCESPKSVQLDFFRPPLV
jgi:hypothetical protein